MKPTYLALDLETTGLDPVHDHILEIGYIVLDEDLTELGDHSAVIRTTSEQLQRMDSYVRGMHLKSGLIGDLGDGNVALRMVGTQTSQALETELQTLVEVCRLFPEKPILLGSSVHFDRSFLAPHMDVSIFSHRHLDASAVKLALPKLPWPPKAEAHRSLDDARESIRSIQLIRAYTKELEDILRYYPDERLAHIQKEIFGGTT